MADEKISAMTPASALSGTEKIAAVQSGGNVYLTPAQIATYVAPGTGALTALGINVGTAGAFVVNGGALGTPSSGVATNLTGLPIGGLTGLGTGVATALAANVTGSGGIALATSPTFVTPVLGAASATSLAAATLNSGSATNLLLQYNATTTLSMTATGALVASGKTFTLGNAATTGLTAGVLAALTNASVVIFDSTGQAYRVPCII